MHKLHKAEIAHSASPHLLLMCPPHTTNLLHHSGSVRNMEYGGLQGFHLDKEWYYKRQSHFLANLPIHIHIIDILHFTHLL